MRDERPSADDLLVMVNQSEQRSNSGKLKIFFGYAAGVGKTYAMLQAARQAKADGRDVVVGYVEPHGRKETEALLDGIEALPMKSVRHREITLREFDVDAALLRKPDLLLVDELAHSNAPGCRHSKRWQDITELLDAGVNVWTTLNVQHIESLNDVIEQITGVVVRETIPDNVFERADDIELLDISPEELLQRLKAGKIYALPQAERALRSFFQKSNLDSLRELSLRQTATRVHTDVEIARRQTAPPKSWATNEKLLVCVGPSPSTARVIRSAKRLAVALDAPWIALCVERAGAETGLKAGEQIAAHMSLAERLGAETITLSGTHVADTVLEIARRSNVTKILVGKTRQPRWKRMIQWGIVEELLERSGDIDLYVIQGEADRESKLDRKRVATNVVDWRSYSYAALAIAVAFAGATGLSVLRVAEANIIMAFLSAVAIVAYFLGRGPAVFASVTSVIAFDFCFVPPYGSITVSDSQYVVTFAVMLAIGLLISALTARLRAQLELGRDRERRAMALSRFGKQLSAINGDVFLVAAAGEYLREMLDGEIAIYLRDDETQDSLKIPYGDRTSLAVHPVSMPTAMWVMKNDQVAGVGTDTLPNALGLFVPVTGSHGTIGVIAIRNDHLETLLQSEQRQWLENCANQLALALERDRLSVLEANSRIKAEAEQLRNTLLSGVSHDLKTPLAAIAGASGTMLKVENADPATRRELLETISTEASRLNGLIDNVLQMSRIDSGALKANLQWHLLEEVVGSAIRRTRKSLANHVVKTEIGTDLPLIQMDGLLIEQLLINLLENAARYTPSGSVVTIRVISRPKHVVVTVSDNGPGLAPQSEKRVFDRFYRESGTADGARGSGLGLAICSAIIRLHGGEITARNRPEGGVDFQFTLPLKDNAPVVALSESQDG